jgi:hypothetical protein
MKLVLEVLAVVWLSGLAYVLIVSIVRLVKDEPKGTTCLFCREGNRPKKGWHTYKVRSRQLAPHEHRYVCIDDPPRRPWLALRDRLADKSDPERPEERSRTD